MRVDSMHVGDRRSTNEQPDAITSGASSFGEEAATRASTCDQRGLFRSHRSSEQGDKAGAQATSVGNWLRAQPRWKASRA